jgi:hypothetical protein
MVVHSLPCTSPRSSIGTALLPAARARRSTDRRQGRRERRDAEETPYSPSISSCALSAFSAVKDFPATDQATSSPEAILARAPFGPNVRGADDLVIGYRKRAGQLAVGRVCGHARAISLVAAAHLEVAGEYAAVADDERIEPDPQGPVRVELDSASVRLTTNSLYRCWLAGSRYGAL